MTDDTGKELNDNNEKIVRMIQNLRLQRTEMNFLIEKQEVEKERIQTELEKLTFKLTLLNKSLNQRLQARINYDSTLVEIEKSYNDLVEESGKLLSIVNNEVDQLEQIMDKKIGTLSPVRYPSAAKLEQDADKPAEAPGLKSIIKGHPDEADFEEITPLQDDLSCLSEFEYEVVPGAQERDSDINRAFRGKLSLESSGKLSIEGRKHSGGTKFSDTPKKARPYS